MEPHADFMAGWALGRLTLDHAEGVAADQAAAAFSLGDTAFNDREHHGEPQFRAAMTRAGFDAGHDHKLSVSEAFEKGSKMAGLS